MGRATRWLKGLFGKKNDKDQNGNSNSNDRRRWSCGLSGRDSDGLCQNPETIPPNITPAEVAWLKSFYSETEKERNKHAIAVAAATAAAADAAVAAAQAAVTVVRLTSQGRGTKVGGGGREKFASIKIQSVFRGYLARRALRALKGLVKIQALVRGYLVRKQTAATLYSMQALIRAQASVRAQRTGGFINNIDDNSQLHFRARKSVEKFDTTRSEHTMSIHSRRLSASFDTTMTSIDENPKIVEVDTGRPKSRSRRSNTWVSDSGDYPYGRTLSSPLPCRIPTRLSMPDSRNSRVPDWGLTGDECRCSTAQTTPRFENSPAKSICVESFFKEYANFPSYMANTQSFEAKLRSQSAPKQRPEVIGPKKSVALNEMMESRNSLSGVRMQRSCSQVQDVISFKNAVVGKLERSAEFVRETKTDYHMEGKW